MVVLSAMSGIAGQEEGVSLIPIEPPDDGIMASDGEIQEIETWMRRVFLDESPADPSRIRIDVLRQDHNVLRFGQSCMETPIIIGNQEFEHGLGTHANSEFLVHLPAGAKTFEAFVGIDNNDDTQGQRGTVKFFVQDGDNILFESPVKKGGEDATPISVQLSPGTATLLLRTDMTEDGVGHDQCDWADARFVMEDGSIRYLDENQNPLLTLSETAIVVADALVAGGAIPGAYRDDALHVALAAVHNMDFLLTWNCKHLANAFLRRKTMQIVERLGYTCPVICTPEELMET